MDLILPIAPMPCPRPRVALRGRVPVAYYPKDYTAWKNQAAGLIASLLPPDHQPYEGPVEVSIICAVERPQTTKLPHPRPDADNYGKALMDAMTQAGVWKDDSLVGRIAITKRWTRSGETPSVYIRVNRMTP